MDARDIDSFSFEGRPIKRQPYIQALAVVGDGNIVRNFFGSR